MSESKPGVKSFFRLFYLRKASKNGNMFLLFRESLNAIYCDCVLYCMCCNIAGCGLMKLRTLINIYDELNKNVFADILYRPIFRRTRCRNEYAAYEYWIAAPSIIHCNLNNIKGYHARSIIYHEMLHQYLEEFLNITEKDHHGKKFWKHYRKFQPSNVVLFSELD